MKKFLQCSCTLKSNRLGNQAASINRTKKAKGAITLQIFKHAVYDLSQIAI